MAPQDAPQPERPLDDVLTTVRDDAALDRLKSLTEYVSAAPGNEAAVASAWLAARKGRSGAEGADRVGQYRLIRELGRGGQAVVWLAEDEALGRQVALKIIQGAGPACSRILSRFRREAEITSKLDHPGICTIHEVGMDDVPFIAMRYVEGETLAAKIKVARAASDATTTGQTVIDVESDEVSEAPGSTSPSTVGPTRSREFSAAIHLVEKAARALHAAHEAGVIHRDVKPGNIIVTPDGEPVLLDFGLAREDNDEALTLTATGDLMGTPAYMSPEQLTAQQITLDRRTDVYSLGVTLFECLTARRPFEQPTREALYNAILTEEAPNLRRLAPSASRDLAVVVETALQKNRDNRYQTALELAEELRRVREYEPIQARSAGPWKRTVRWAQRNPAVAAALVIVFATMSTAAGLLFVKNREVTTALRERTAALASERAALADFDRLADVKRLQEAERAAAGLWPARPTRADELAAWLARYSDLADALDTHRAAASRLEAGAAPWSDEDRRADHGAALATIASHEARLEAIADALEEAPSEADAEKLEAEEEQLANEVDELRRRVSRRKTWRFTGPDADLVAWKHGVLRELIADLEAFTHDGGTLASVRSRHERARGIVRKTVDAHRTSWDAAIARIAKHSKYGVTLKPQVGLIPLGPDPTSRLEEFLHFESHAGPLPRRGADGRLEITGESGVILVLVPAGRFWMGSQKDDPRGRNHDPDHRADEQLREVTIARPFFLSKYEMTQGQWSRLPVPKPRPSRYGPGFKGRGMTREVDDRHPVEHVSWVDCNEMLARVELSLPTEEQWEYAARAGTDHIWPGTSTLAEVPQYGNVAGIEVAAVAPWQYTDSIRDDWVAHAPAGRFKPNAFGLHDLLGNVWEWTATTFGRGASFRVLRGGGFGIDAGDARVAMRIRNDPTIRNVFIGVRPAARVVD